MPRLCSCPAGTTARATMLAWGRQMFRSPRLIWQVMFSRCIRTSGRISTTCKKRAWLPWTCILFKLLLMLLSACVPQRKPMRNPLRKLFTRTRQEPSGPVLKPRSRLPPGKSVLRGPANFARKMGACILCTLPRTAAGTRKTEQWKPISAPSRRQVKKSIQWNSHSPSWARYWTS